MKKVLTIAGSSTGGGAGLQADLKAFAKQGVYGMTAITTVVVQDPNDWSHTAFPMELELLRKQLNTILDGIGVDAVKTGMLGSVPLINLVAEYIDKYNLTKIVIDPVLACKGADNVQNAEVANALRDQMVKRAFVLTPNLLEAGILTGKGEIKTMEGMKDAAKTLYEMGAKHVVVKGGSRLNMDKAIDVYYDGTMFTILENELIPQPFNHGAGCTFASTVAALLAKGRAPLSAVRMANRIVHNGIKNGFKLNQFTGCLNIL